MSRTSQTLPEIPDDGVILLITSTNDPGFGMGYFDTRVYDKDKELIFESFMHWDEINKIIQSARVRIKSQ